MQKEELSLIGGKEKLLAITAHCGYLAFGVGFGIIPLAIYLFNDGKNSFVAEHAKQALKAQAIIGILSFVAAILSWVLIGLVMWPFIAVLALVWFCCSIYACFRVLDGREYHYPLL